MVFVEELILAFQDLLLAPFREPSLLWQLAPVLLLWVLLEVYFMRYRAEELGWNSALANGVSLFWLATSAMQHIYANNQAVFTWTKFIVISVIILYAIVVMYIAFKHASTSKLAFVLASPTVVYYLSILGLLYAYDMIYPTLAMLIAVILVFTVVLVVKLIVKRFVPEAINSDQGSGFGDQPEFSEQSGNQSNFEDSTSNFGNDDNSAGSFSAPMDSFPENDLK